MSNMAALPRNKRVHLILRHEEHDALFAMAKARGMELAAYLRDRLALQVMPRGAPVRGEKKLKKVGAGG